MRRSVVPISIAAVAATVATTFAAVPTASAAPALGSLAGAGERAGATRLSFTAGDSVQAQVDVGSGNLLVSVKALSIPGLSQQTTLGAWYNSAASDRTPVPRLGKGWGLDYSSDVKVVDHGDGTVTYTGPSGLTGVFERISGSTSYTSPAGFKVSLVKTSTGWTLTDKGSQEKLKFGSGGGLASREDRNGNATTVDQASSATFSDVDLRGAVGPLPARTVRIRSTTNGSQTTLSQGDSADLRQVKFNRSNDSVTSFADALNRSTAFTYSSTGLLTRISAPGNVVTDFAYDSSRRVTSITQAETASGGPGSSVTRLAYPSSTQTLLAGPDTDQAQPVSSVPRTTYTVNSSDRVTKTVDAEGREQSKTYTANFDTATSTKGSSTTTNTWGANGGDSLTKSSSSTGSSQSLSYAGTGGSQYSPTGSTDDAGNKSAYTYNGAGNQLTSIDAGNFQSKVDYNSDGTVKTATSPGNGTNSTSYSYDNKQVVAISPVTGSSLDSRDYTYDDLGRLKTSTNGRGTTTTFSYDLLDRVTSQAFTGGTTVTYGYDAAGRNNQRVDSTGTTTYGYDQLGRLTARKNTAGGGLVSYGYDKASNLISSASDAGGQVGYTYDDANVPSGVNFPLNTTGGRGDTKFTVDDKGRRTGTYLRPNNDKTTWKARNLTFYDGSDRVTRVVADQGNGDTDYERIIDTTYCYRAGSTPSGGCTGSSSTDRDKLQWKKDAVTGKSTVYTYDTSGRLTKAAVSDASDYTYGYNARGNRTSAPNQSLSFNAASQISSSGYSYDAAGNITNDPSSGVTGTT